MAENRAKIDAAAQATETVVTKWSEAQNALTTCWVNGYGVLCDPSLANSALLRARKAIDEALAAFNGVSWPHLEDYE